MLYEIDHCTAFGPCSARGITPSSLLVCGEQISRQKGETAREALLFMLYEGFKGTVVSGIITAGLYIHCERMHMEEVAWLAQSWMAESVKGRECE